jgi:antitoxin ParD1/3/4
MTKPYVLTPDEATFAEELVSSGRFASVDDVVQEALRLLKDQEDALMVDIDGLRRAWREGVESGDYQPADEVFDRLEAKYRAMAEGRTD